MLECDKCGFKGENQLFPLVNKRLTCCGPEVHKCPNCDTTVMLDFIEQQKQNEERAKKLTILVKELESKKEYTQVKKILQELSNINKCSIHNEELSKFIKNEHSFIKNAQSITASF